MQQERISKEQIQKDIKNGVCKVIDGFFVYSDKVVQYTSHFGYTINRGTLYKGNGMVISRATDKKRFSVARLIAKAFLVDQETDDAIIFEPFGEDNIIPIFKEIEQSIKDYIGQKYIENNMRVN